MTHTLPALQTPPPPAPSESSTYDAYGRLSTSLDFQGNKTVYAYDSLGRVATKTLYPYNNLNTAGETITYHFDSLGRNDTVTDTITGSPARVTSYGFDVENRVTSVTTPEGSINYGYDQQTGRHTETSTTNSDIQYGYDNLGHVNKVTVLKQNGVVLGTSLVINYYYTKLGLIDHITYPNGTETDYGYDNLNRLTSVTNKITSSGNILSSYSYTLNNDGLRTGVTEQQLESGGSLSTTTKTWTYDNDQRLTGEAVTSTNSGQSYTDTYQYDLVGNRVTKTDVVGTTTTVATDTFNAEDQLTSETGTVNNVSSWSTTFGYDANGSMTSVSRTGAGAESDTYGYDLQHRLSSGNISRTEQGQSVTIAATYLYDDSGYRAQGSVTVTVGNGSPTTTVTNYLTDTMNPTGYNQMLEEKIGNSSSASMSYFVGLSVLAQTNSSGATTYMMIDGQGSTRQLTDSSANITARFAFDAYGDLLYASVGVLNAPSTKILFTGQLFDATLQWYYLRDRFGIPSMGRFNRMDRLMGTPKVPLTLNRYIYAGADPINACDPSGQDWILNVTIATALRGGIAALTIGVIRAVWAYAKGATLGEALWEGFKAGALTGFAFVSPLFAWSMLAATPILIGLAIYSGDLKGKDVPEIASYIAAGIALNYLFKTPAYNVFEVKTALRFKVPQAITNLKNGTSANAARNFKWAQAVKRGDKMAEGTLIHSEVADLMREQEMGNLKIEVSYDPEGNQTYYSAKDSVRVDYEVTANGKTARVIDLKPDDVIRGSWIEEVASRLELSEEDIEAFSYGEYFNEP